MKNLQRIAFTLWLLFNSFSIFAISSPTILNHITEDYKHYYHGIALRNFGAWVATGAVIANSNLDKEFQNHWQHKIRNNKQDKVLKVFQNFGENAFSHLPLFLIALSVGNSSRPDSFLGSLSRWGDLGIRIWALSGPQQLFLTNIFGGERPSVGGKSHWNPFHGYRGVSGHAFFGAVPWLAASEAAQSPILKNVFFTFSMLPALARVNNNFHFISQAWLGWGFAYLGMRTIAKQNSTENVEHDWVIMPIPIEDGMMLGVRIPF